ncbi:unnamed protein product [Pleuronectes platessa]|uniref:Uncharacterized protein n=1 Tax=Pleuronectes platessa TaxID=8262 RepID=A0A9N7Z6Y8_PLEPL|nr:unnamed protein product [Pleuronectes platessa]
MECPPARHRGAHHRQLTSSSRRSEPLISADTRYRGKIIRVFDARVEASEGRVKAPLPAQSRPACRDPPRPLGGVQATSGENNSTCVFSKDKTEVEERLQSYGQRLDIHWTLIAGQYIEGRGRPVRLSASILRSRLRRRGARAVCAVRLPGDCATLQECGKMEEAEVVCEVICWKPWPHRHPVLSSRCRRHIWCVIVAVDEAPGGDSASEEALLGLIKCKEDPLIPDGKLEWLDHITEQRRKSCLSLRCRLSPPASAREASGRMCARLYVMLRKKAPRAVHAYNHHPTHLLHSAVRSP